MIGSLKISVIQSTERKRQQPKLICEDNSYSMNPLLKHSTLSK